jgi:uncharacterized protein
MPVEIGHIEALFRYPVKSMRGERLATAALGWHGLEGDRRFGLRRLGDRGGFPWLSASRLPALLLYGPERHGGDEAAAAPTHVRTPEGELLPILGDALARNVGTRYGAPVEMMELKHGIFDDASVSVISSETIDEISRLAGIPSDVRRFRPNVLVRPTDPRAFDEDRWVGRVLAFGEAGGPAVALTARDLRCSMVNLDPDAATAAPQVMKAVVRVNENNAGAYGTVTRAGMLSVGQRVLIL